MIIAVDGPAASGKGTLAQGLARHYGLPHLDTGLLYRAVGCAVSAFEEFPDFEARAAAAAEAFDGNFFTDLGTLQTARAGLLASKVAAIASVRQSLFGFQRAFSKQPGGAVLDGRDIGTMICPEADVKLYIEADSHARSERRALQLEANGLAVNRRDLKRQIDERDLRDRNNPHGAFYRSNDAEILDTTYLGIAETLRVAIEIVEQKLLRTKP